jgi:hypothetical protein
MPVKYIDFSPSKLYNDCRKITPEKHHRKSGEIPAQVRYCNSQILSAFSVEIQSAATREYFLGTFRRDFVAHKNPSFYVTIINQQNNAVFY